MPRFKARNSINATTRPALNPKIKKAITHGISSKRKVRNGSGGNGTFRCSRAKSIADAERSATPEIHRLDLLFMLIDARQAVILK
ncbi:MAG: hypothetical protein DRN68_02840 [Thaumarchaeota archaeon]|nr:MAG: hypothetical protein DRN68_02840 [Nitrososphaerota archaeon]